MITSLLIFVISASPAAEPGNPQENVVTAPPQNPLPSVEVGPVLPFHFRLEGATIFHATQSAYDQPLTTFLFHTGLGQRLIWHVTDLIQIRESIHLQFVNGKSTNGQAAWMSGIGLVMSPGIGLNLLRKPSDAVRLGLALEWEFAFLIAPSGTVFWTRPVVLFDVQIAPPGSPLSMILSPFVGLDLIPSFGVDLTATFADLNARGYTAGGMASFGVTVGFQFSIMFGINTTSSDGE